MVGVPGRSKACLTCIKRKKGCDKRRPTCTQCASVGVECGGYERKRIFLNNTVQTRGIAPKPVPVVYQKAAEGAPSVTDVVLQNGLAQTAYVEKYISIFLAEYLPTGRPPLITNRSGSFPDWVEIAHGLHTSDKATQLALLSFGLFAAGESQSAVQSYCYALRKLQASLCVPRKAQGDSTLATCQLLGLFEVFHGADDDKISQGFKWHSHLNGLLAVIHTRKPSGYQSGASHQLFVEGRYPLLISALKNRQHFPLNSPEWRTIPWKKEPKSFLDKLYDVLADVCDILADTDEMRRCDDPATKTIRHGEVVDAYQRADESLRNWFIEASPLTIFHDCEGTLIDPTGPSDMLLAHMTLLYWSLCFILYSTFISIYEPALLDIPTNINPLPYLQRVARALPYFWRPGAGMCGANLAAPLWGMCLHIAYATPDRYPEEIRDLERISLQPNVANSILPFLQSLQRSSVGLEMAGLEGREGMILRAQRWIMGQR